MMRWVLLLLLLATVPDWGTGWGVEQAEAAPRRAVTARPAFIRTRLERDMFPRMWRSRLMATPLAACNSAWSTQAVRDALAYYPRGLARRYVSRIYIVDRLYLSGMNIGGTRSADRIYLAAGSASLEGGHSLARRLHAEMSSILLQANSSLLNRRGWRAANPRGFRYVGSGTEAVRRGRTDLGARSDLLAKGFLHTYAMSSMENDFNAIASALFVSETRLTNYAATSSRLRRKVEITKRFYRLIHPFFVQRFPRTTTRLAAR